MHSVLSTSFFRLCVSLCLALHPDHVVIFDSPEELDSALARGRARRSEGCGTMADALKEAASKKLEGFSQDVKVRLVP